jgi:hypothetical protein
MNPLTPDEHFMLHWLSDTAVGHPVREGRGPALDKLIDWRLAALVGLDRVALTAKGRALLKKLGKPMP